MPNSRLETLYENECISCRVFFDVGYNCCREPGCKRAGIVVKPTKRYVYQKKPQDPVYTRYMTCRNRSGKRGLGFDLTIGFVKELIQKPCHYCYATVPVELDRKDNEMGYTMDNVVPACRKCNMVKNHHLSYEQMIKVAEVLGWR